MEERKETSCPQILEKFPKRHKTEDFEDFGIWDRKELIQEIKKLRSQNSVLTEEVENYKKKVDELQQFKKALDFASEGVLFSKKDKGEFDPVLAYANEGFSNITGYSKEECIGKNCRFLQGRDTDPTTIKEIGDAIRQRKQITTDILNYTKNGKEFWNRISMAPVEEEDGTFFIAIQNDITRLKQLQQETELLRRALNAAEEAILIADLTLPDQPIIYCNAGFEKMTGYKKEEVLGKNCRFLQGKDTDRETVKRIKKHIDERRPYAVEILNYRKDGSSFWNQFSLTPVPNDRGVVTHYVAVQFEHPMVINQQTSFLKIGNTKFMGGKFEPF